VRIYRDEPIGDEHLDEVLNQRDQAYDELFEDDPDDRDYPDNPESEKNRYKGPGQWMCSAEAIKDQEELLARLRKRALTMEEKQRIHTVKTALKIADDDALWVVIIALQYHLSMYEEIPQKIQGAREALLKDAETEIRRLSQEQIEEQHQALIEARNRMTLQILKKLDKFGEKQLSRWKMQGEEITAGLREQAESLSYSHQYPWLPIWVAIAATTSLVTLLLVLAMLIQPEWFTIFHA